MHSPRRLSLAGRPLRFSRSCAQIDSAVPFSLDTSAFLKLVVAGLAGAAGGGDASNRGLARARARGFAGCIAPLDALHLAAALEMGEDLRGVVTYDDRLIEASRTAGVEVMSPT